MSNKFRTSINSLVYVNGRPTQESVEFWDGICLGTHLLSIVLIVGLRILLLQKVTVTHLWQL